MSGTEDMDSRFRGNDGGEPKISKNELEKLKNRLKINRQKQSKLTDAYLENLLGEDVFRGKIEELRKGEDELKKLLAGHELREIGNERSEGYINRVKDFLDEYDEGKTKIDFADKKAMCGLLFKNIKIAPPVGGALPKKKNCFFSFPPF